MKMKFFVSAVLVTILYAAFAVSTTGCCNSGSPGGFNNMCQ